MENSQYSFNGCIMMLPQPGSMMSHPPQLSDKWYLQLIYSRSVLVTQSKDSSLFVDCVDLIQKLDLTVLQQKKIATVYSRNTARVHLSHLYRLLYIAHFHGTCFCALHYLAKERREGTCKDVWRWRKQAFSDRWGGLRQERENIIERFSVSWSLFHSDNSPVKEVLFTSNSKQTQHIF